jgi:tRNA(fMet)-specific endonuclease VapC
MPRYMLDTNICIYVIKRYPGALSKKFEDLADEIAISAITFCELHFGVSKSRRRKTNLDELELFVERLAVLDFPARAASRYGETRAFLDKKGTPIGIHDLLIGAHALTEDLTLVTNNRREFDRIPGLRVENWAS